MSDKIYYLNRFANPIIKMRPINRPFIGIPCGISDKIYYCEEIKVILGCWELSSERVREIEESYRKVC